MSGVLQKFCRRQSGNSPADDRNVAWRLGGGKSVLNDVEKLPVISVLQAVKERISEDPTDGDHHHHADQDQRNWGGGHNKTTKFRSMRFNWSSAFTLTVGIPVNLELKKPLWITGETSRFQKSLLFIPD